MPMQATVNYHIKSDVPQVYSIDAEGIQQEPETVPVDISVKDTRHDEIAVTFKQDSILFMTSPSQVKTFGVNEWATMYDQELTTLLKSHLQAREVIVFDHTIRIDDPQAERRPARNVHTDYSQSGAHQRLQSLLGDEPAAEWEQGHFAFVNIWRPVDNVIKSAPLGFITPRSISPEDQITLELIYPDRTGQIMGLTANKHHEWFYWSAMTPDDIAVFNIYDNQGLAAIYHSALDLGTTNAHQIPRKSIESRTLIRY